MLQALIALFRHFPSSCLHTKSHRRRHCRSWALKGDKSIERNPTAVSHTLMDYFLIQIQKDFLKVLLVYVLLPFAERKASWSWWCNGMPFFIVSQTMRIVLLRKRDGKLFSLPREFQTLLLALNSKRRSKTFFPRWCGGMQKAWLPRHRFQRWKIVAALLVYII